MLEGWDDSMELQIRINPANEQALEDIAIEEPLEEFFGEYCDVTDERSVLVENGKLTIIGDWLPE